MKLNKLLKDNYPSYLHHPDLGNVNWVYVEEHGAFLLVWAEGQEKGEVLLPDSVVILDSNWSVRD